MSWFSRLRNAFRSDRLSDDVEREMAFHLAERAKDLEKGGLAPDAAAAEARHRFGNPGAHGDETRDRDVLMWLEALVSDARYAWRSIARTPGFTLMVVATLALGVGVNSAMFSFLDRVFLRPPAGVEDPSSLRRLWLTRTDTRGTSTYELLSYPVYRALQALGDSAGAKVAVFSPQDGLRIGRNRDAPPVHGVYATPNYFDVLGVRPAMGRTFAADENTMGGGAAVAVISDAFWKMRLGGDPEILGKQIHLGAVPFTVIGILPQDFVGVELQAADVWMPLARLPGRMNQGKPWYETAGSWGMRALMRVPPGFDDESFGVRTSVVALRAERELRDHPPTHILVETGSILAARGPGDLGPETTIATRVAGVALIVLLIAIANVVNLLLARAVRRRQEIAVRLALGVSRWRLVRLLVTESVALSLLAGGAAILTAWWGGGMLRRILTPNIEWIDSALDARVVLFALAVAIVAGVVAGAIPAIQASNPRLTSALKSGSREGFVSRSRLRTGLVIVQAAFSVVLLVGASLFVRTRQNVESIDLGYDVRQTMMAELLFEPGEEPPSAVVDAAMRDVATRMKGRPGVERVARAWISPMRGYSVQMFYAGALSNLSFVSSEVGPMWAIVSPAFFEASGLRMLRGRTFGGSESGPGPNEVVLNEVAARLLYPESEPLGQCVRFGKRDSPCHTVVGVVENSNARELIERKMGQFFVPFGSAAAEWRLTQSIVLRARQNALPTVANELRREIRRAVPLAYPLVISMGENLEPRYREWRLGATLFTTFGALALIVALVGIYSSVSYMVGQRMHEFGVRIALGARTRDVLNHVLGDGVRVVTIGVAVGLFLALAAGRLVQSLLFGVDATDVSAMLLSASTLLAVAVVASLVPAVRAARVDPVVALRAE